MSPHLSPRFRCPLCGEKEGDTPTQDSENRHSGASAAVPPYGRQETNRTTLDSFSRRLTKLLRHEGPRRGLLVRADGFVSVSSILPLAENRPFFLSDLLYVISTDEKQRFQLAFIRANSPTDTECTCTPTGGPQETMRILPAGEVCCTRCAAGTSGLHVRATQGHSISEVESRLLFSPIRSQRELEEAVMGSISTSRVQGSPRDGRVTLVHGTYLRLWDDIKREGLKRMRRRHVHFTPFWGVWGGSGSDILVPVKEKERDEMKATKADTVSLSVSGFRASCDLLLILDLEKAMEKGLCFFLAANGVVLTEGNGRGAVPPDCIAAAVERHTGKIVT